MKTTQIIFDYKLEGKGIVNYDSSSQKFYWMTKENHHLSNGYHDNVMYSKKVYNEDGTYKVKISSDCLKKAIFKEFTVANTPSIINYDPLLMNFIAHPMALLRGYLLPNSNTTYKRKSCLSITPAIQNNDSLSFIDFNSRSGQKNKTSRFSKENIGDITYVGEGFIDLSLLEFLSADFVHDRYSFNPDKYEILKDILKINLPNFNEELKYYKLITSSFDVPEYGVKLTNEHINFLVKKLLKLILKVNILRKDAYAKLTNLRISLDNGKTFIDLIDESDIDNINIVYDSLYTEVDFNEAVTSRENILTKK